MDGWFKIFATRKTYLIVIALTGQFCWTLLNFYANVLGSNEKAYFMLCDMSGMNRVKKVIGLQPDWFGEVLTIQSSVTSNFIYAYITLECSKNNWGRMSECTASYGWFKIFATRTRLIVLAPSRHNTRYIPQLLMLVTFFMSRQFCGKDIRTTIE